MLNKWRLVEYTDDGCSLYECLKCKDQWESRSSPRNYCSECGTKWEGKLEPSPRRELRRDMQWEAYEAAKRIEPLMFPVWSIEWQCAFTDGWEPFKDYGVACSAVNALRWLERERRYRRDEDDEKFRIVLAPKGTKVLGKGEDFTVGQGLAQFPLP